MSLFPAQHARLHNALRHMRPFYWREALICVPALPLLLLLGLATGNVYHGAIAAGAAFALGFGAARNFRGRRWGALVYGCLGMTVASFVGSLAGGDFLVLLAAAALVAAGVAALSAFDEGLWWVSLQCFITLLVAGYYPGPVDAAFSRAAAVLAGGATQVALVVVLARLAPRAGALLPSTAVKYAPGRRLAMSYTVRAAVCVALALYLAHALGLANSYWAPMTAMLILKPGLHETQARGLNRLLGTLAGCAMATLYVVAVDYSEPALVAGVAVAAGAAYAVQKAHYASLSSFVTATVVLFLSLGHGGAVQNAEHRILATLLGGVIALAVARIAPHRATLANAPVDRVGA